MFDLEEIVTLLDRQWQRATYGAVAGYLGVPQQSLMKGLPMERRYSWIVNAKEGKPTGYPRGAIHPALVARVNVIKEPEALAIWLSGQR